ncbi:MAG TPA: DUF3857 and transglutaminase domain-containing protein, partial [Candidatus Angelobacter sp.]|nr:DUF3857 and transglutaminase domain-containing protein [Candidatus Angelobacter sp.]
TYHRIKILTEEGKKYANVEIPIAPWYHFIDVKARTIHPDGSIVEFTGKPMEKVLVKTRDVKFVAQTLSMPDVTVGSIIEYKYRYTWEYFTFDSSWTIQHDLYTLKEHFWLRGTTRQLATNHYMTGAGTLLSYVIYGKVPAPHNTGTAIELDVENEPAFKSEEYAPPVADLKPIIRFFYGGSEMSSPEAFWQEHGREWFDQSERFIGNRDSIRKAVSDTVGSETDPQKKLRLLYLRAQQTRNLSFERRRSKQEDKKEEIKANENAQNVLERGYGTHNDITRLFVALARAAGFDAEIVRAPNRKEFFFKPNYPSTSQLASEIAVVKVNGNNELYLDPGTEFCPFGMVRWVHTSDKGLRLDKTGGTFVLIPPAAADKSQLHRVVNGALSADGSLSGKIVVEFKGNTALEHRLAALEEDDAGRRKALEDEVKEWLPEGATATLDSAEGWESSEEPLRVTYKIEAPSFASVAGKRLLVPATLFKTTRQKEAFQRTERKFSVYFPFAYQEMDNFILQIPEGYSSESVPTAQDVKLASTRFATARTFANNQFVSKRALIVNGIIFPLSQYPELKGFFDKLQAADEEQLVLQNTAVTAGK